MRTATMLPVLALLLLSSSAASAQPTPDSSALTDVERGLEGGATDSIEEHVSRGSRLAVAFTALTGEAISPLFGVTARSLWVYWTTPSELRSALPTYCQPFVWGPLVVLLLMLFFKGTIGESVPMAKKPLDAAALFINKGGAVVTLPLALTLFANAFSEPTTQTLAAAWDWVVPTAHAAGEAGVGAGESAWLVGLGWLVSLTLGSVVFLSVWVAFHTVEVAILISPFPMVDAGLKSARLGVIGLLAGASALSPYVGFVLAAAVAITALLMAGWSVRLSLFGMVYAGDIMLFRSRRTEDGGTEIRAFSGAGLLEQLPVRTYGFLTCDGDQMRFTYRPWFVRSRKVVALDSPATDYCIGTGLINAYLMREQGERLVSFARLPPRYQRHEDAITQVLGLGEPRDVSVLRGVKALFNWIKRRLTRGADFLAAAG